MLNPVVPRFSRQLLKLIFIGGRLAGASLVVGVQFGGKLAFNLFPAYGQQGSVFQGGGLSGQQYINQGVGRAYMTDRIVSFCFGSKHKCSCKAYFLEFALQFRTELESANEDWLCQQAAVYNPTCFDRQTQTRMLQAPGRRSPDLQGIDQALQGVPLIPP